eukprot:scaffold18597_cov100-Isochrysis_galbana.AAC.1
MEFRKVSFPFPSSFPLFEEGGAEDVDVLVGHVQALVLVLELFDGVMQVAHPLMEIPDVVAQLFIIRLQLGLAGRRTALLSSFLRRGSARAGETRGGALRASRGPGAASPGVDRAKAESGAVSLATDDRVRPVNEEDERAAAGVGRRRPKPGSMGPR